MRFLLVLAAVTVVSTSCGSPPIPIMCSANTCGGCCGDDGVCRPGGTPDSCGTNGNRCVSCTGAQTCQVGACQGASAGGSGGTAGGSGTTAGGAEAGGSAATAGGSSATAGGNTAGGNAAGGNTAGGNAAGGNAAGGNTAGGNTAGGSTAGGNTAGGTGTSACNASNCVFGGCKGNTCELGTSCATCGKGGDACLPFGAGTSCQNQACAPVQP
ncbi:MAG: hypothetical protein JNK82_22065, partial [Myxococcaceae bacterium]|nr:hypothetical protein [Myxococcaceae bacterium]